AERRVLEIGQPGATLALRQEEIPEGALARLRLELLHDRGDLPASRSRVELLLEDLLVRVDVLVHEIAELLRVHLGLLRKLEFHVGPPGAVVRPRLYSGQGRGDVSLPPREVGENPPRDRVARGPVRELVAREPSRVLELVGIDGDLAAGVGRDEAHHELARTASSGCRRTGCPSRQRRPLPAPPASPPPRATR